MLQSQEDLKNWIKNANTIRGLVIARFCSLEYCIVDNLTTLFSDDPQQEKDMLEVLIERMSFEEKRQALKQMLQRRNEVNNTDLKNDYIQLMNEIQKLIVIRNRFAHYPTAKVFDLKSQYVITLKKYKDGIDYLKFTQDDIDDLLNKISNAEHKLFILLTSLIN